VSCIVSLYAVLKVFTRDLFTPAKNGIITGYKKDKGRTYRVLSGFGVL